MVGRLLLQGGATDGRSGKRAQALEGPWDGRSGLVRPCKRPDKDVLEALQRRHRDV
jgi:hypothetical protein